METGVVTLTSFISPYEKDRQMVRSRLPEGDFIEVHMDVSLPTPPPSSTPQYASREKGSSQRLLLLDLMTRGN
jgi:hypothetical protein